MADLYKLQVKLEAESAKLHSDLDKANSKLGKFQKSAGSAGKALKQMAKVGATAVVAIGAAFGAMAVRTVNLADKIGKMSQSTGVSVETLSRLSYAADLSGVSLDEVAKSTGRLQRAMFDASAGLKAPQEAFDQLGVVSTDANGKLRDTEAVMLDVAEKFSTMADGAEKAALAQVLFGKAGVAMIPFLNQGAKGIKAMTDEADAFGLTMDNKLTAAAERTNDNLTRMRAAMEGVFLRVMAKAMPHIENITKAMVAWAKDTDRLSDTLAFLGNLMKTVATGATILKSVFNSVGKVLGGVVAAVVLASSGEFSKAGDALSSSFSDASDAMAKDMATIENIWKETPAKIAGDAPKVAAQISSPIVLADNIIDESITSAKEKLKTLEKAMKDAVKKSADISKEFKDRFDSLTSSPIAADKADVVDVGMLEFQAKQALKSGDIDGALKKVRSAFDVLDAMKAAGTESGLVLEGLGASLKRVGDQIAKENITQVNAKVNIDMAGAVQAALEGNKAMQAVLDASPLMQSIQINPASVPNNATQAAQGNSLQPMTINMPNGGQLANVYADPAGAENFARSVQKESMKRGTR